jgi:hypothetical protein
MSDNTAPTDPTIRLELPLSLVNFVLETLNINPKGGQVMQVAAGINMIRSQTEASMKLESAEEKAPAVRTPTKRGRQRKG